MEEERSLAPRTLSVVGLGLLAFSVTILAGDIGTALLVTNSEQPCNSLVRSGDGASVVADVELPRREGVAARKRAAAACEPTEGRAGLNPSGHSALHDR
jgi:Na+-transporting methylmalonyl-CoA/oxaloacetate decarboxylase beta subunit